MNSFDRAALICICAFTGGMTIGAVGQQQWGDSKNYLSDFSAGITIMLGVFLLAVAIYYAFILETKKDD